MTQILLLALRSAQSERVGHEMLDVLRPSDMNPRIFWAGLLLLPFSVACASATAEPHDGGGNEPSKLTAETCEQQGGTVVGDIGDGAIHRPDYRCASGERPLGTIEPVEGGSIAVEGSVCCR